jgi:hypothetical protein
MPLQTTHQGNLVIKPTSGSDEVNVQVVSLAKADLLQRIKKDPDLIRVVSVTENDWNNSSLGCSQKGDMGGGGPYYPPTTRVPEELPKLKDYSDNTGRSLDAAAALVSDKKELAAGQKYHQQMAAVADKNGTDPKSFYAPPADEKAADTSVPQAKSSSRSGGSVSSPASGGGPSGLATVSTQEKPVADLTPRLAEDPREAGAGYAGGGSAAAGGGIKGAFSSLTGLFGMGGSGGGVSGAAGGVSEQGFEGRELAASASGDPANYLTFIDKDANLFKVVEKRYKRKEMDWAK